MIFSFNFLVLLNTRTPSKRVWKLFINPGNTFYKNIVPITHFLYTVARRRDQLIVVTYFSLNNCANLVKEC